MRSVHLSTGCPPNPSTLSTQPGSLDPAEGGQDDADLLAADGTRL